MSKLKICFSMADQTFLHTKSIGILNVSLGVLENLLPRTEVEKMVVLGNSTLKLPQSDRESVLSVTNHPEPTRGKLGRTTWDQLGVYTAGRKSGCDWLFLPKGYSSFLRKPPLKLAAYVHDAMPDFYRTHYARTVSRAEEWYFRRSFAATLRDASVIFTNSEFTRQEVLRMAKQLNLPPPRVVVAGIGFAPTEIEPPAKADQITMLVSRWPHKLTSRALEFLLRWQKETRYSGMIHLVGELPARTPAPAFPHWKHWQRMPGPDYDELLSRSRALIYFSAYEGFGMPPIEAILRGTAPVYSSIPAMAETSAGCGFSFDNDSYDNFSAALNQALACPPAVVKTWMDSLRQRHNWSSVAERVIAGLSQDSSPTVLHLIGGTNPEGGVASYVRQLLSQEITGFEQRVWRHRAYPAESGAYLCRGSAATTDKSIGGDAWGAMMDFFPLSAWLRHRRDVVLHAHSRLGILLAVLIHSVHRTPVVIHLHSRFRQKKFHHWLWRTARAKVIFNSQGTCLHFGGPVGNSEVLMPTLRWPGAPLPGQGRCIACSLIVPHKKVDVLIEGFNRAVPRNTGTLHIYGLSKTPFDPAFQDRIISMGKENPDIHLHYWDRHWTEDLGPTDIFIHGWDEEPFGIVLLEAYARGCRMVPPHQTFLEELPRDGIFGAEVTPSDMAEKIKLARAWQPSADLWQKRQQTAGLFAIENTAKRLAIIYRELCGRMNL